MAEIVLLSKAECKDPLSGRFVKMLTDEQRKLHRTRSVALSNAKRQIEQWEWAMWQKYGITHADFLRILSEQGGGCAVCGAVYSVKIKGKKRKLHVDHNHITGTVRGILCFKCNVGLGKFDDNPETLRKAAAYLEGGCST